MAAVLLKKIPALKSISLSALSVSGKDFVRQFYTILGIGLPIGLSDAGFSLIYLVLSGIISIFGKEPLAAVGIAHRIEALPFFISLGFSMAVSPMVGQYLGAGTPQKAKESVYLSLKITSIILFVISALFFFFAPQMFSFFTDDPRIISHGADYLRIIAFFEVFLAFEVVLGGAFSGAGDTRPPFMVIFPITLLRIPAAYLLAVTVGFRENAIWFIIGFTTFLKGVLLLYWFNREKWMKKKV
jgi:Na+-driven multidrug efflux pump